MTGERYEAGRVHGLSRAGRPLLVRYDLAALAKAASKEVLAARDGGFWRYREFLPVRRAENVVSLGEVMTPLVALPRMAADLGVTGGEILVKDEGRLPTGSFKARGLALAVAMAKELGLTHLAMPTNGNAGAAMAAYGSRAGLRTTVFCPDDTPEINISEIALQGARVYRVNGLINDCGKIVGEGKAATGWFDLSTLKEPYRIEGKKTMGLELAEQLGWDVPDVIFYPTGGGTGLIGMWKAFAELEAIGWIGSRRPRMVAVQASGCAPIVKAFEAGEEHAPLWENAHTVAAGIRVPVAVGDFLILRAVRESGGFAIAVDDEAIIAARDEVAAREGFLMCPEGAATYAAYKQALADGRVAKDERVVLYNCATGLKYPMPPVTARLDRTGPIDYAAL
ncbi:MAG: threonine synthase [Alphaproteobacteria bacterium]|nr:MAG: threonine synthase [Alphaproteobacteria bacterium]